MTGNGITKEADVPIKELKRKIRSYHLLMKDGRIRDLDDLEVGRFTAQCNKWYSELDDDERAKLNEIKDEYVKPKKYAILG